MGCCAQQVGLVLVPPEELSVGACCEQKHQTWWNPKVTNIVHSSSGVLVQLTDEHPKVFKSIHLRYVFKGRELPMDKLEKAVVLSMDRYCGVSAMLAKAAPISWEIVVS